MSQSGARPGAYASARLRLAGALLKIVMLPMRPFAVFALLLPLTLCADPPAEPSPARAVISPDGIHISNGVLRLGISARDAGAVSSIVYDGAEMVNDHDHGRQLQIAWFYNGLGEPDNPTEAGSATDALGATSTSQLLDAQAGDATVTTRSHPAYWYPPGFVSKKGGRSAATHPVTADTLEKTLTLGYHGDPHVIVVDAAVTISPTLTAPEVASIIIETPAFYTGPIMTESYLLDLKSGECVQAASKAPQRSDDTRRVLILSSSDGRRAVGLFAPKAENFMSYNCRYVDRHGLSDDNVAKVTLHYRQPAKAGDRLEYRTFAIVGDLKTVKASIMKLR